MLSGIKIIPVPKKGMLSTREMRRAYLIGCSNPSIISPMDKRKNVKKNNFSSTEMNLLMTSVILNNPFWQAIRAFLGK